MRYLMVVPVPFHRVGPGRAAIESAFGVHLRALLASVGGRVTHLDVLAPAMQAAEYEVARGSLLELDATADRIEFVEAYPQGRGRLAHLLGLPRLALRTWRAVGRAHWVHAGPSSLFLPFENVAILCGWLRRRRTIFVEDIDQRRTASMNLATGVWSRGVYLRRRYVHDVWSALQLWLAARLCSLVMLKGMQLVADYGRGRPNVHFILDCAHSAEVVLDDAQARRKLDRRQADPRLRACYFGRLVPYKGVDRMLRAVQRARRAGADVSFDVYGAGESLEPLRRLVTELGLDEVVRFHGARPYGREFFAELEQHDLLLAAPLSEDTPRSAVDAQALGMAVLAFDTYYYQELAAMGAGVEVVPWPDVDAMAGALVAFARDRSRLATLAQRGIAFARENTQEHWVRRRAAWTLALG